ncbi:MAG: YceI family protein [Spirosomaceae bacterium]|jgi:polyisoprenoid-binding protein YceI|nr:YceI family protein [Spirosomataceae bacterium]
MKTIKFLSALLMAGVMLVNTAEANGKKGKATALKVDASKSVVKWNAKKITGEHYGTVTLKNGSLTVDGGKVTGGSFEMDMNSIKCEDLTDAGYNGKLIGHLKSDDFFSVAKHPVASFKITKVEGNNITGDLTIKGITNSVTFPATIKADKNGATATAKIVLDRTKWDIRYGSKKFFESIGDKAIYDDFSIDLTLAASK